MPLDKPQPALPDDLTYDDIHGDFRALFTIHADGSTAVKMLSGTGNGRLDQLAMDAAKRWRFRPATVDGKPVDSFTRLAIQFYST
ncbi:MAG: energy transducer TonB [Armatimonadota bacterium]|nr:energy transducer TonB [Armatimonadota bacterium]